MSFERPWVRRWTRGQKVPFSWSLGPRSTETDSDVALAGQSPLPGHLRAMKHLRQAHALGATQALVGGGWGEWGVRDGYIQSYTVY